MTETSDAGIDSGPFLAPNPAPWRLVVQAAWPVMTASVQTARPKGVLGTHACWGNALALGILTSERPVVALRPAGLAGPEDWLWHGRRLQERACNWQRPHLCDLG